MKRQQAFIASMINRVMSAGTLTRPDRLYGFATSLADSIEASPDIASAGKLAISLSKTDGNALVEALNNLFGAVAKTSAIQDGVYNSNGVGTGRIAV